MKCNKCGCEFDKREASIKFNQEFHGELDYDFDVPGLCGDCGILYMKHELYIDCKMRRIK